MESAGAGIAWKPYPRQELALSCPADELLFGGAAGGGKSDFLLADFLYGVGFGRTYQGILFRRTYNELEDLIKRSYDFYLPLGAQFNQQSKTWTFPGGETLKMRYCLADRDVYNYQGHAYQWEGWDELGNYPNDFPYRYMLSRLRSAQGIPCHVRGTANPGGPGHAWVKNRFIDGKIPEKIYADPETGLRRVFIPSLLEDNPALFLNDKTYEAFLKTLPPNQYRALRLGDWEIFAGQVFEEFSRASHVVKPFPIPQSYTRIVSLDWGYSKPYSLGWWAFDGDGRAIRYREMYGCQKDEINTGLKRSSEEVAREAWNLSAPEGIDTIVADPAIWSKIDDAPSIAERFESVGWKMVKADNARLPGLQRVHDMMKCRADDGRPMLLVFDTCFGFIRTIPTLTADERNPEDVDSRLEDHIYDETRYALMSAHSTKPIQRPAADARARQRRDAYDPLNYGNR